MNLESWKDWTVGHAQTGVRKDQVQTKSRRAMPY